MLSASDHKRIKRALTAARQSRHHRFRVGAVVSVSGRLSVSANIPRNDARVCWQHASTHAEIAALADAYRGGAGGTLYVARVGATGRPLPSFPCDRCVPELLAAGVRRVVWFTGVEWAAARFEKSHFDPLRAFD